jgi:hypothetical protein
LFGEHAGEAGAVPKLDQVVISVAATSRTRLGRPVSSSAAETKLAAAGRTRTVTADPLGSGTGPDTFRDPLGVSTQKRPAESCWLANTTVQFPGDAREAGHERRSRRVIRRFRQVALNESSGFEHADPVCEGDASTWSWGDVHDGGVVFSGKCGDLRPLPFAQIGIEVGKRFVAQQYRLSCNQRPSQRHPLLLAAG